MYTNVHKQFNSFQANQIYSCSECAPISKNYCDFRKIPKMTDVINTSISKPYFVIHSYHPPLLLTMETFSSEMSYNIYSTKLK